MSKYKKVKCPYCDKSFNREDLARHIEDIHSELIPENDSALRIAFNAANGKPLDYHGICVICKKKTPWNETKGRYDRLCGSRKCHDQFIKNFEDNAMKKNGYVRPSETIEGQEKLLQSRKIAGWYEFPDGCRRSYVGSYEKRTLQFMDRTMNCHCEDIVTPGPVLQYKLDGVVHNYISDIYYVPYNLIIEVKDGGDHPNTRNMPEYRRKQLAKEEYIIKHTNYNYVRLTDNDFSQLLSVMMDLKMSLVDGSERRVVHVNESTGALMGALPMNTGSPNDVFIVDYMQNNVFSGEDHNFAISNSPMLHDMIYRSKDGKLKRGDKRILTDSTYDIYVMSCPNIKEISETIMSKIGSFVSNRFLLETVLGHRVYTDDQIQNESKVYRYPDVYSMFESVTDMIVNSIEYGTTLDRKYYIPNESGELFDMNSGSFITEADLLNGFKLVMDNSDENQKMISDLLGLEV